MVCVKALILKFLRGSFARTTIPVICYQNEFAKQLDGCILLLAYNLTLIQKFEVYT